MITSDDTDKFNYERTRFSVDDDFSEPSYTQLLDWAKDAESKSLALDIWARGNYIRYLMSRRKSEDPTVIVPFKFLDELRCYYRRMALMGIPAHFVYVGDMGRTLKCVTLHPGDDYLIDAASSPHERGDMGTIANAKTPDIASLIRATLAATFKRCHERPLMRRYRRGDTGPREALREVASLSGSAEYKRTSRASNGPRL